MSPISSYSLLLIEIIIHINFNVICSDVTPSSYPRIWLKSFKLVDSCDTHPFPEAARDSETFQIDSISKNGSVYEVLSEVSHVYFMCESDYPIRWNFPLIDQMMYVGHHMYNMLSERSSHFQTDSGYPLNFKFYSVLEIFLSQSTFFGGKITCEVIDDPTNRSTGIYVYAEGEEALQAHGQTLSMNVSRDDRALLLPCRPSLPSIPLSLSKKKASSANNGSNDSKWIKLELSDVVSFNPMYGFKLVPKTHISYVKGQYKCQLSNDPDVFLLIDVEIAEETKSKSYDKHLDFRRIFSSPNAFVSVAKGYVECCTGANGSTISTWIGPCKSGNQCELVSRIWANDLMQGREKLMSFTSAASGEPRGTCFVGDIYGPSGLAICRSPEMDVAALFTRVYEDLDQNGEDKGRSMIVWTDAKTHLHDVSQSDPKLDEKITFHFASHLSPDSNFHIAPDTDTNVAFVLHTVENEKLFAWDWDLRGMKKGNATYLTLHRGDRFEGENLFVICFSLRFYYANGGWLRVNWKNGTKTVLQGQWNNYMNEVAYMGVLYAEDNVLIGEIPEMDMEMESVDCFAPKWNTIGWDKRNLKLNIKAAISPKLFGPEIETITLSQKDQFWRTEIRCAFSEGKPAPKILWEKDGKLIDWKTIFSRGKVITFGNITSLTVYILNATDEMAGDYRCIARNKGGEAVKQFKILVVGQAEMGSKHSGTATVLICLLSTFFGILLVCLILTKRIRLLKG